MRYESIELTGYIGIYNGLSLGSITLDLTQCVNNKILIVGPNGSGKSTIISSIHPYPDTNDKFMPGVEAKKTLTLMDGNVRYVIKYIHPIDKMGQRQTTRGYIAKIAPDCPPVELNPSGNVSMCRDIIYNEFELDPGFSSLARISNEDRGLVERKPAERKKIVSYIVSSLETYNSIYKSITKKHNLLKSLITNLSGKIDMIGDESKLVVSIENIGKQIDSLEKRKNETIETIAAVKIKVNQLNDLLSANKYEETVSELNMLERSITGLGRSISTSFDEVMTFGSSIGFKATKKTKSDSIAATVHTVDDMHELDGYLRKQITTLEAAIESDNRVLPSMLSDRESEAARLQDKQQQLNSIKSEFNYVNIKEVLDGFNAKSAEYKAIFDAMGLLNINVITKDEYNAAMESLGNLRRMSDALTHNYPLAAIRRDIEFRSDVVALIDSVPAMENDLKNARHRQGDLSQQIALYTAKRELAGELVNRPKKCKIDTCIYISAALKADREYPEASLIQLQNELSEVESLIADIERKLDDGHLAANVRKDVSLLERELGTNWKFISKLPITKDFSKTFMQRVLALDPFHDIDELYKYVDCGNMLQEYQLLLENIKKYEAEAKVYESKAMVIESIISDISELESKINTLAVSIAQVNGSILNNKKSLLAYQTASDKLTAALQRYEESLIPAVARRDELLKIKTGLDISVTDLAQLDGQLTKLTTDLGSMNAELKNLSTQREAMSHSLVMLGEYRTELDRYQKDYMMVEKIRYYSSPSTGVQNVFLSIFMSKILQTANQLLGLLFGGRFMFGNFIINESEFRIPCIGEAGIMHDDISEMSSAEKSMLSLVISFSLLHASSTRYNILELDEADAMLDSENRFAFINLLDQIMQILNVEQVFIISHNPEIDVSACDVINLRANQPVVGANIIWQA